MGLIDAIPDTIKEIGQAKARGVAAPGAYGVLLGDVGQMISTIPAQAQQARSMALREQMASLEVAKAQREAAADNAVNGAYAAGVVNPDGTINKPLLTQHLVGTPGAARIPSIMEAITRMEEGNARVAEGKQKVADDEDEAIASAAFAAKQAGSPEDQAGLFAGALAGLSKSGRVRPERTKAAVADMLGDDGNPDPEKVPTVLDRYIQSSKTQRTLAESDARTKSLEAERQTQEGLQTANTAKAQAETDARVRANYASQLAGARTPQRYATIYAGIPDKFKADWDTPEEWNADSTPQHILESVMTPAERETARRDRETAQNRADDLKVRQGDLSVAQGRLAVEQARERREAGKEPPAPILRDTATDKAYKAFVTGYDHARSEERERSALATDGPPAYMPPPSQAKWSVMTPAEREMVVREPKRRIDDAEMARRSGSPLPSGVSNAATWDKRADGSDKGDGFLGVLQRPDGRVSSELSVPLDEGEKVHSDSSPEIPLLVPTLSKAEVQALISQPDLSRSNPRLYDGIVTKAKAFAKQRQAQGKPYFAQPGEQNNSLYPDLPRATVTGRSTPTSAASPAAPAPSSVTAAPYVPPKQGEVQVRLKSGVLRFPNQAAADKWAADNGVKLTDK